MGKRQHETHSAPLAVRQTLCSRLFQQRDGLADASSHGVRGAVRFEPHVHDDLLQLNLLVDCGGRAFADGQWQPIEGVTALATGPGILHGYNLMPNGRAPFVYQVKLRVAAWSKDEANAFDAIVTKLTRVDALIACFRMVVQLNYIRHAQPPALLPRLAEIICRWPNRVEPNRGAQSAYMLAEELPVGIAAAVKLIDDELDDPPDLERLAAVAHLSPRHFARQFQAHLGCTAHAYATTRRYAAARELLLGGDMKIRQVAERLGFSSPAIFSRWFTRQGGMSPRAYRESPSVM